MGIPQITDRLISAPAQALRAVFTGIGRIVMAADRPQVQSDGTGISAARAAGANGQTGTDGRDTGQATARRSGQSASTPAPAAPRWRSLDATGNVRLLSAEDLDDGDSLTPNRQLADPAWPAQAAPEEPGPTSKTGTSGHFTAGAEAETTAAAEATAEAQTPAAHDTAGADEPASAQDAPVLPLASYDSLSLPSIRARLRNLDATELRILADYERTHAERPEVLGMLERRIEKVETGG